MIKILIFNMLAVSVLFAQTVIHHDEPRAAVINQGVNDTFKYSQQEKISESIKLQFAIERFMYEEEKIPVKLIARQAQDRVSRMAYLGKFNGIGVFYLVPSSVQFNPGGTMYLVDRNNEVQVYIIPDGAVDSSIPNGVRSPLADYANEFVKTVTN